MPAFLAPILASLIPYKLAIFGAMILAAIVTIDRRATYKERAKCNAAAIQSQLNAVLADLNLEKIARAVDATETAALAAEKSKAESDNAELAKRFKDRCVATDDDIKRLRR